MTVHRRMVAALALSVFGSSPPVAADLVDSTTGKASGCNDAPFDFGPLIHADLAWSVFPQWVPVHRDRFVRSLYGQVALDPHTVHISAHDTPFNHADHDLNFLVDPDPASYDLLGTANLAAGESYERGRLEVEWEHQLIPLFAWPSHGDRLWIEGHHVFDCGHPPYRTEIHPPRAVVTFRNLPAIFPDSAGQYRPAMRADIWIGNAGGGAAIPCKEGMPGGCDWTAQGVGITDDDVLFEIPVPVQPSKDATLKWVLLPTPGDLGQGAIGQQLQPQVNAAGGRVSVRIPLKGSKANYFAGSILVGWDKPAVQRVRRFLVTLDDVQIISTLPDGKGPSNFHLWMNVNDHWTSITLDDVQKKTYPLNQGFVVELFNQTPLHLWAGGYKSGCIDGWLSYVDVNSPQDALNRGFTGDLSLLVCHSESENDQTGVDIGPAQVLWNSGQFVPGQCPQDYGTDGPHAISDDRTFVVHYRVHESLVVGERVVNVAADLDPDLLSSDSTQVTGSGFLNGETVNVALVRSDRVVHLGSAPVRCATSFALRGHLPPLPGGPYTVVATGSAQKKTASATTTIHAQLKGQPGAGGVQFTGYSFGENERVNVQHIVMAQRRAVPVLGRPSPQPVNSDLVPQVVAEGFAITDGNGGFQMTMPPDHRLAPAYVMPSLSPWTELGLDTQVNSSYVAIGTASSLRAEWRGGESSNANAAWKHVTNEPNRNLAQFDPTSLVSLVADKDRYALVGEEGRYAGIDEAAEYFEARAKNSSLAPLPAATYQQLAKDSSLVRAADQRHDSAAMHKAMKQLLAHLPPRAAREPPVLEGIRSWALTTDESYDRLTKKQADTLREGFAPVAAAMKAKNPALAQRELTALARRLPTVVSGPQAARVQRLIGLLQTRLKSAAP